MKRPAFQFYPGDWLEEKGLRASSLAARGLWIDLLCYLHQGEPYGHARNASGYDLTPAEIARAVGESPRNVARLLDELERHAVFSRTAEGTIYCRRMVRDEALRTVRAEGGVKAVENPRASRPGEKRHGGRTPSTTPYAPPSDDEEGDPQGVMQGVWGRGYASNPPPSPSPSPSPASLALPPATRATRTRETRDPNGGDPSPDLAAARAAASASLQAAHIATGRSPESLLAEASRTPGNKFIGDVGRCTRPDWLRTTAECLDELALGAVTDAARASPRSDKARKYREDTDAFIRAGMVGDGTAGGGDRD